VRVGGDVHAARDCRLHHLKVSARVTVDKVADAGAHVTRSEDGPTDPMTDRDRL
jgi:hypothetical protein